MLRGLFIAFTLTIIPIISYFSSNYFQNKLDTELRDGMKTSYEKQGHDISKLDFEKLNVPLMCTRKKISICNTYENLVLAKKTSLYTIIFALVFIAGIFALGQIGRLNRTLLLVEFILGLRLTQIISAGLIIINACLVLYLLYFAQSYWIGRVYLKIMFIICAAAGVAVLSVLYQTLKLFNKAKTFAIAKEINEKEYPKIWSIVKDVANKMNVELPTNVIIGLEPNFYVTEVEVSVIGKQLFGRTLYLSLPLCNLLTENELKSIIGHEFGHFKGRDTLFSRWFYPIYRGATETLNGLHRVDKGESAGSIVLLPSMMLMTYFIESFSHAEAKISRERELIADKCGQEVTGDNSIGTSLVKIHKYASVMPYIQEEMIKLAKEEQTITSITTYFLEVSKLIKISRNDIINSSNFHPTDSHPPLGIRCEALGMDDNQIEEVLSKEIVIEGATSFIDNHSELDKELSEITSLIMLKNHLPETRKAELGI